MNRRWLLIAALAAAAALAAFTALFLARTGSAPPAIPRPTPEAAPLEGASLEDKGAKSVDAVPQRSIVVERSGARRVSCVGACAIEAKCGLRGEDACVKESCEGDVRKATRADFCLADAASCADAARCPCEEACWKRGECAGDHGSDAQCTAACGRLVEQKPADVYAENRCVLESACGEIPACAR